MTERTVRGRRNRVRIVVAEIRWKAARTRRRSREAQVKATAIAELIEALTTPAGKRA